MVPRYRFTVNQSGAALTFIPPGGSVDWRLGRGISLLVFDFPQVSIFSELLLTYLGEVKGARHK